MSSGKLYNYGRVVIVCIAILLLLTVANQARKLALAGLYNHQTEQYLSFWRDQQKKRDEDFVIRPRNFNVAMVGAEKGIELLPGSAEQNILKARLLWWGEQYRLNDQTLSEDRAAIISTWQTAVRLRPSWPYGWSDYAMALAQQSILDKRFEDALILANQLGPWEPDVMETSAILGKHYKGWLSPELSETLNQSTGRLIQLYPRRAKNRGVL